MARKTTLEDYKTLGKEMKPLCNKLIEIYIKVCNTRGVNSSEAIELKKACRAFDKSKSLLDDHVAEDYPDVPTLNIFYGASV